MLVNHRAGEGREAQLKEQVEGNKTTELLHASKSYVCDAIH